MKVQDVRIDYGLGSEGATRPEGGLPPAAGTDGLPAHFTRIRGSVVIQVSDGARSETITVTSDQERLDEGFVDLCRALRSTLRTGDGWSRGVALGIDGPSLILRGSRARFFKVGLRQFTDELFGAARRLYEDVHPALGPLARRSLERYLHHVREAEREVRAGLTRPEG